jgi:hypothetical protein
LGIYVQQYFPGEPPTRVADFPVRLAKLDMTKMEGIENQLPHEMLFEMAIFAQKTMRSKLRDLRAGDFTFHL